LADLFNNLLTYNKLTCSFIHSFIYLFIHSFIHSLSISQSLCLHYKRTHPIVTANALLFSYHYYFTLYRNLYQLVLRMRIGSTENAGPENEGPKRDQKDQRPTDTTGK